MSNPVTLAVFLIGLASPAGFTQSQEDSSIIKVPIARDALVSQQLYPDSINGCAPASLLNALKFGDPKCVQSYRDILGQTDATKLRYIIDRYFRTRPSLVSKGEMRWGFHGVFVRDFEAAANDLLREKNLKPCRSEFLDRNEKETSGEHLSRIHHWMKKSLQSGFPPILSLRSFLVKRRQENNNDPKWEIGYHHFVLVHSLPEKLPQGASGFEAAAADPNGPRLGNIYIHLEPNGQPFSALKGNEIRGRWLSGRPFLLVAAPGMTSLRPANLEWSERFIVTVNFLTGRF